MLRSVLLEIKKIGIAALVLFALVIGSSFKYTMNDEDWLVWANRCLAQSYDASGDARLKKWELTLTPDSFIRLRKTYQKGKEEYYSFNLHKLNDMDYLGTTNT